MLTTVWLEPTTYEVSPRGTKFSQFTNLLASGAEDSWHRASLELGREVDCETGRTRVEERSGSPRSLVIPVL